jgi:uncharacterized protein YjiS (DUF1127 family)
MHHPSTCLAPAPRARFSLWRYLRRITALARQRRDLAQMEAAQLHDLGLTRAQAQAEAAKKPWDVPQHWLK